MSSKNKTGKGTPAGAWFAAQSFHRHEAPAQPMIELDDALAQASIEARNAEKERAAWDAYNAEIAWAVAARKRGDTFRAEMASTKAAEKLARTLGALGVALKAVR